jgi:hypothetical protein
LSAAYTTGNDITDVDSDTGKKCFLIIEGRDDYSSQFANRVTVLLGGGYAVRLDGDTNRVSVAQYTGNAFSAGDAVKVENGIIKKYGDQGDTAAKIVGTVLKFDANSKTLEVFVH